MSTDSRISARALASRMNGARSRGPKSTAGKARSAQNALKHGMRAAKHVVLPDEDAAEFAGLEATLLAELAPVGALPGWGTGPQPRSGGQPIRPREPPGGGRDAAREHGLEQQADLSRNAGSRTAGPGSP